MTDNCKLAELIARHAPEDGSHPTAIPGLWLARCSQPSETMFGMQEPAVCLIAQGRKRVMLGELIYENDSASFLAASVDLPISGQVIDATPERPYLSMRLNLDTTLLTEMVLELESRDAVMGEPVRGLSVSATSEELVSASLRLMQLLDKPADIPYLAPLAQREIYYRLLTGEQGGAVRSMARCEARLEQINRAIGWIKRHYNKPFSIEAVAAEARMSASTLHHHFKSITAMSPLQYQKQLRLQEARRLMIGRAMDAASAAYEVGYESPSQFTREYGRMFGVPPARDVARLRAVQEGDPSAA